MADNNEPRGRFVGYRIYGGMYDDYSVRITNRDATITDLKFQFYGRYGMFQPGMYDLYCNNVLLHDDDLVRIILPTGGTLDAVMRLVILVKRRDEVVTLELESLMMEMVKKYKNKHVDLNSEKCEVKLMKMMNKCLQNLSEEEELEFNYPNDFKLQRMEEDFEDGSTIIRTFGVRETSSAAFHLQNMGEDLDDDATLLSLGIKATSNKLIAIDNDIMDSD
ncbi:hypothetical protein ACFE04_020334 [Oxalis oulophora]